MKQGDRLAFNEIYERYWLKLYTAAIKRMRSKDDAKDLVQDLFFSLWMKRDSLVIKSSLSAYLLTAMKYKVINYIESNLVKEDYLNSLQNALIDYDNSTNEEIIGRDLESFIDSRMNVLSPKVREVFELSRKENLSVREISEKLHVSDQTVKNQISKAIKILKLHLSEASALFPLILSLYC